MNTEKHVLLRDRKTDATMWFISQNNGLYFDKCRIFDDEKDAEANGWAVDRVKVMIEVPVIQ